MFLKVSQNLPLTVFLQDKNSSPIALKYPIIWRLSDSSLASLEEVEDSMSRVLVPIAKGTLKIQVLVEVPFNHGTHLLMGELYVEIIADDIEKQKESLGYEYIDVLIYTGLRTEKEGSDGASGI